MSPRMKAGLLVVAAVVTFAFFPTLAEIVGKPWQGSLPSVALSGLGGITSGCLLVVAFHQWRTHKRGTVTLTITADASRFVEAIKRAEREIGGAR